MRQLDERYRLLHCAELDAEKSFTEVRAAWNVEGLVFQVRVEGKRQPPWCRESRPDDSDGLRVWIDTRDTHNIHRATALLPSVHLHARRHGPRLDEPVAEQLLINRARENAKPVRPGVLQVRARNVSMATCWTPSFRPPRMTGFDPQENPRLGFTYALVDRELGEQTWSCPSEFPYREDPSLWGTLELVSE